MKKNDILKSKERLVKVFLPKGFHVSKYEEIQKNDELWSTAMAMQLEEARYRYDLEDSFEKRIAAGKMEEKRQFLHKLIEIKYHDDHMTWLCTLTAEQIENISNLILTCDTFQELKCQVESKK